METSLVVRSNIRIDTPITPVVREIPADLETPTSVYMKLRGAGPSFLLESVTGGENVARYSFIGIRPRRAFVFHGTVVELKDFKRGEVDRVHLGKDQDPLDVISTALQQYHFQNLPGLPRLVGGMVGYLSYDVVRYFEPTVGLEKHKDLPEAIFLQAETIVVFDHAFQKLLLIGICHPDDPDYSVQRTEEQLDEVEAQIKTALPVTKESFEMNEHEVMRSNTRPEQFTQAVMEAKKRIARGEIFQVVLSQRLSRNTEAESFEIYRALRRLNPSPYMFYFDFDDLAGQEPLRLIGASPEMHARLEGQTASLRPIAGTRRRGKLPAEDKALEHELLADTKELAEHVMLVDLGRNDLGRICQYGSVKVSERMVIERYSHVMHIVSHIEGTLQPESDAFDLIRATFPAGTVSGAPKIRAMQIISELEPEPRGPYGGIVGYFSYDGGMDMCIAIRTMILRGKKIEIQAGAGIVADSIPENEYKETLNKARALELAIEVAENIQRENSHYKKSI